MSREWRPGDVAERSYLGKVLRSLRVGHCYIDGHQGGEHWHHEDGGWDARDGQSTYCRLVVIDPEDDATLSRLWRLLPDSLVSIDQLQAALREFDNPKPPKPEEPQGLGARVTDRGGLEWAARTGLHPSPDGMGLTERRWGCLNGTASDLTWDELIDARGPLTVEVDQ